MPLTKDQEAWFKENFNGFFRDKSTANFGDYARRKATCTSILDDIRLALAKLEAKESYPTELRALHDRVASSQNFVDDNKVPAAWSYLKEVLDKGPKLRERIAESLLAQARWKPVYLDKVKRIEAARTELEAAPGTADAVNGLGELLTLGKRQADAGRYEEAYRGLEGLSGLLKGGRKSAAEFRESGGSPKVRLAVTELRTAITDLREVGSVRYAAALSDAESFLEAQLVRASKEPSKTDDIVNKLTERKLALADHALAQRTQRTPYEEAVRAASEASAAARPTIPETVWADVELIARRAESLGGAQQYELGREAAVSAKEKFEAHVRTHTADFTTYGTPPRYPGLLQKLLDAYHQSAVDWKAPTLKAVDDARSALQTLEGLEQARSWKDAIEFAASHSATIDDGKAALERIERLAPLVRKATERTARLHEVATRAVEALGKAGGDTSGLSEQLAAARRSFDNAMKDPDDDRAITSAEETAKAAFEQVQTTADDVRLDDGKLGPSKAARTEKDAIASLEQKVHELRDGPLALLERTAPGANAALRQRLIAILENTDGKTVSQRSTALDVLRRDVEVKTEELRTAAREARNLAANDEKALEKALAKARPVNLWNNGGPKSMLCGQLDRLDLELEAARRLLTSDDPDIVKQGHDLILATQRRVSEATSGDGNAYQAVHKAIDALKNDVDNHEALKTHAPDRRKVLLKRIDEEVRNAVQPLDPKDALAHVAEFRKSTVDPAFDTAKTAQRTWAQVERPRLDCIDRVAQLDVAPDLESHTRKRLQRLAKLVPGTEASALREVLQIQDFLTTFVPDPNAPVSDPKHLEALTALNTQRRQASLDDSLGPKEWEGALSAFEKSTKREVEAAKSQLDGDISGVFDAYELALSSAKKLAKSGNYVEARKRLDDARRLGEAFAANPESSGVASAKALGAAGDNWKTSITSWLTDVSKLHSALGEAHKVLPPEDADSKRLASVRDAVAELMGLFAADAFDAGIAKIRTLKKLKEIRFEKELILGRVRQFQALTSSPLVVNIEINPYHPVSRASLTSALAGLEHNAKRA